MYHWAERPQYGIISYGQGGGVILIPAWINNQMSSKVWDEITYPIPNFNDEMDKQFHHRYI